MLISSQDRYRYYLLMKELDKIESIISTLRELGAESVEQLKKRRNEIRREMKEMGEL